MSKLSFLVGYSVEHYWDGILSCEDARIRLHLIKDVDTQYIVATNPSFLVRQTWSCVFYVA